jgi:hypothetical protein
MMEGFVVQCEQNLSVLGKDKRMNDKATAAWKNQLFARAIRDELLRRRFEKERN